MTELEARIVRLERAIFAVVAVSTYQPDNPEQSAAHADLRKMMKGMANDQGLDWSAD